MVCVVHAQEVATLVYVVDTTEFGIHLFQHDTLGLWDEEVDEDRKQNVDAGEHVKGVEATVLRDKLGSAACSESIIGLTVRKVGKN